MIARLSCVLAGLVVAMVVSGGALMAQAQREPIRIALLHAITGPLAVNGTEINEGRTIEQMRLINALCQFAVMAGEPGG